MNSKSDNYNTNDQNQGQSFRFETGIGPVTDNILNTILDRLSSDGFKEKLTDKIVDPVTTMINKKIKPYVKISIGLYSIVIVLLCIIIYLIMSKKYS